MDKADLKFGKYVIILNNSGIIMNKFFKNT
jgi:hypothetical protein